MQTGFEFVIRVSFRLLCHGGFLRVFWFPPLIVKSNVCKDVCKIVKILYNLTIKTLMGKEKTKLQDFFQSDPTSA